MSELKLIFAAAAVSAVMLAAGCSAKSNTSTVEEIPTDASVVVTETTEMTTEPIVSLSKETTQPTTTATTVEVEATKTTVTATGYVAATDYRTFEGTGLDGEAGGRDDEWEDEKGKRNVDAAVFHGEVSCSG